MQGLARSLLKALCIFRCGVGFWGKNPAEFDPSSSEESFYQQVGVEPQLRFEKFFIEEKRKEKISKENLTKINNFLESRE